MESEPVKAIIGRQKTGSIDERWIGDDLRAGDDKILFCQNQTFDAAKD